MTRGNGLVQIPRVLRAAYYMAPLHTYLVAALDGDDGAGDGLLEVGVAGYVCVVYVLDGVVGEGGADACCEGGGGGVDAGVLVRVLVRC